MQDTTAPGLDEESRVAMSERPHDVDQDGMAPLRSRIHTRIEKLRQTKSRYDKWDKGLIAASIVFGVCTTITAAADLRLWAVALSALVTGTVSAQHWFALGPRGRNADLARVKLQNLELDIEMGRITADDAVEEFAKIETDFLEEKAPIGSQLA